MQIPPSLEAQEAQYNDIMRLFDDCDALADTVQPSDAVDPEAQLVLVAPLISDVSAAADDLAADYIDILENPTNPGVVKQAKSRVEASLRKITMAMDAYKLRAKQRSKVALAKTEALVAQLQEHVDKVIVNFVSMLSLSLARIMHSHQVESFKRRHQELALNMHRMGQQLSQ